MLKHKAFAAMAFATVAGAASLASAHTANPSVGPGNPTDSMSVITRGSPAMYLSLGVPSNYNNQIQTDRARVKASPKEWKRAVKAASLINAHRCDDAYALAVVEKDERLADGVKQACSAEQPS